MSAFERVDTMMHGQTPHPPRPHQVYGLQELLEAELLAVVLVQDAEHEVGRGHAVVQVREQVRELLQRQPAGEVILKAVIIITVTMIMILTWNPTYISSISSALCLVCWDSHSRSVGGNLETSSSRVVFISIYYFDKVPR